MTTIASSDSVSSLPQLSVALGEKLLAKRWRVATAESCTGGGVAAAITATAGSSDWFEYGIVSYANKAKQKLLQVNPKTLLQNGAVSEAVVQQMLAGILKLSGANLAIAVSGIAGPGGGNTDKPVGTVWFAWGLATGELKTQIFQFKGDRVAIQAQAVEQALRGLLDIF